MKSKTRIAIVHLIGIIIARASFFSMNPLAIGYFTAAYLGKAGGGLSLIAALVGVASAMPSLQILKYLLTMISVLIIFEAPVIKKKQIPWPILNAIPAIILGIFGYMEATALRADTDRILLAILEAVITYVAGALFKGGVDYILKNTSENRMDNEQTVSMAVIVAVIIYAVPELSISYLTPVKSIVYFMILFFTYKYGAGQGTITGSVCGFSLGLRGGQMSEMGFLTMLGIIPAIFRELGRIATASAYLVTAAIMGLLFDGRMLSVKDIGAMLSAVLVFLLLPPHLTQRMDQSEFSTRQNVLLHPNYKNIARKRMLVFSESFLKLSKTLESMASRQAQFKQQEINRIFEDISDKLCKNCNNCNECWGNNFNDTYQAACRMFDIAEKRGTLRKEDIPLIFNDSCICADQFVEETNRGFEIIKLNQIWQNRLAESRGVIAEQLKEVSSVIENISGDFYGSVEVAEIQEDVIARCLKAEYILAKNISVIERGDKRKEIYLNAACKNGHCVTAKEAASIISNAIGIRMRVSDASKTVISREYDNFIFVEDTNFKVLTGVARAMKENVSGDNFSVLKLETGEVMIAISDGMGTGKEACEESEAVMALLEQLIEAGVKAETAIKLINSNMVLKADQQTFSTIDMGVINLFTGICEFVKVGAASAFIKRSNWVETISSTTLPIGMLGNVDYDTVSKKLYEGDIVILVSDGVLDCILEEDKEAYMERLIMEIESNNPQEIANRILDNTLAQRNYIPMDDMTVITAGMWLK